MTQTSSSKAHIDDGSDLRSLYWGVGSRVTVRLSAEQTLGKVGVTHFVAKAGESVPLHSHTSEDELFLVASGKVLLTVDDADCMVGSGGVAFLPRGSVHRYFVCEDPSEFFVVTLPGGFESFFVAAGLALEGRSEDELAEAWSRERTNAIERQMNLGLQWLGSVGHEKGSKNG